MANSGAITVRGLKLQTQRRAGTARPPLLLLHGIGGSLDSWGPFLAALPDRDIVMVDCPGAGRSDVPRHAIPMATIAEYIAEALRELDVEPRIDVVGYSLGGMVAQELARRHPDLIRRLVLASTVMGFHGPLPEARVQRALMSTARYFDPAAAARDIPVLAGGRTARDPDALAAIVAERASHPPPPLGYLYQQWAVIGWSSRGWLSELPMPTLVLHGDEDPVVHEKNARMMARRIPRAELEIVEGAGHMMLFDESEKVAEILERFLGG